MGIICFPSLQRLAEDVSNQFAQEIQKALVGKPAGKRRAVLEDLMQSKTALWAPPRPLAKPLCFLGELEQSL